MSEEIKAEENSESAVVSEEVVEESESVEEIVAESVPDAPVEEKSEAVAE